MPGNLLNAFVALTMFVMPAAASAHNRGEVRDAREDYQEERREYRYAQRYGDDDDVRGERREYRDAARDLERQRERERDQAQNYRRGNQTYNQRHWNEYRQYQNCKGRPYPYQRSYYYRNGC